MRREDIKVGMLVKSRRFRDGIGLIVKYPGDQSAYVLYKENIVSWNIGFFDPVKVENV